MSSQQIQSSRQRRIATLATISLAAFVPVAITGAIGSAAGPPTSEPEETAATSEPEPIETLLPVADESERVDLDPPTFADPTTIDNALFPVSNLESVVALGNDEGIPVRVETSVLSEPIVIDVDGQPVEALGMMLVEYQSGRILDVAIKWYAQADDGSVWFLGEDSFTHEDGVVVADADATWRAGPDRPITMVMPSDPETGDVFRPENQPDSIEEYTVTDVGVTFDGPTGPVEGAIVVQENHTTDGVYEDKWYAPEYGELSAGVGDSYEAVAIAVPADATEGPVPNELTTLGQGAYAIVDAAAAQDWESVAATHTAMQAAWDAYQASYTVPPLLADQMNRALSTLVGDRLVPAAVGQNSEGTANAALDVAQASLDLQLQFRTPSDIERERIELWARQLVVDANRVEVNPALTLGDIATLEWVLQRSGAMLDPATFDEVEGLLAELRLAAFDEDTDAVIELGPSLVNAAARNA